MNKIKFSFSVLMEQFWQIKTHWKKIWNQSTIFSNDYKWVTILRWKMFLG